VSGTIRRGKRTGTWELRVSIGRDPLTGRYRQASRTVSGTKRDAERALAEFVSEVGEGAQQHAATSATVAELLTQWLDLVRDRLSPSTFRTYCSCTRIYLVEGLGRKRVRKVTTRDIDLLYQALTRERGLSARTVHQVHAILRGAFGQAMRWGWIRTNPVVAASPPPVRKAEVHPPDPDVVVKLLSAADELDHEYGVFLRLAAATGARRGELCALRWSDLDTRSGTLVIARNLIESPGGVWLEKDTKTHQVRRIALDPATRAMLQDYSASLSARAEAVGGELLEDGFVFTRSVSGSEPWLPGSQTQRFNALCRRLAIEGVRLHDLRHMHATQLLGANIDVRTVAGRLGHANAATTLGVYAQFLQVRDRDAAEVIGTLLNS
jgi:integrase